MTDNNTAEKRLTQQQLTCLYHFYCVETLEDLVAAQDRQITSLQSMLRSEKLEFRTPREG